MIATPSWVLYPPLRCFLLSISRSTASRMKAVLYSPFSSTTAMRAVGGENAGKSWGHFRQFRAFALACARGYLHGSLIANALLWSGTPQSGPHLGNVQSGSRARALPAVGHARIEALPLSSTRPRRIRIMTDPLRAELEQPARRQRAPAQDD
jgi:hypothetical protein